MEEGKRKDMLPFFFPWQSAVILQFFLQIVMKRRKGFSY